MAVIFWDASALVKRYYPEDGSEAVDAIISNRGAHIFSSTAWSYAETYSILLRRFNGGTIDRAAFNTAVASLQAEVVHAQDFDLLALTEAHVFSSIEVMRQHNLNATDAILLSMLMEVAAFPDAPAIVVATSDHRLVRAAAGEGFAVWNPEEMTATQAAVAISILPAEPL